MKIAAICFHKDATSIYQARWLTDFRMSIERQTYPIDFLEIDYGGGNEHLLTKPTVWLNDEYENHAAAQNALLDLAFKELDYDAVLNTNVDDVYSEDYACVAHCELIDGADIVSSNFTVVNRAGARIHLHDDLHRKDIVWELSRGNNPICHPTVAYSRAFWIGCSRYDPSEVPLEDMRLWQREARRFRFVIAPENLVTHRVHEMSVSERR